MHGKAAAAPDADAAIRSAQLREAVCSTYLFAENNTDRSQDGNEPTN